MTPRNTNLLSLGGYDKRVPPITPKLKKKRDFCNKKIIIYNYDFEQSQLNVCASAQVREAAKMLFPTFGAKKLKDQTLNG